MSPVLRPQVNELAVCIVRQEDVLEAFVPELVGQHEYFIPLHLFHQLKIVLGVHGMTLSSSLPLLLAPAVKYLGDVLHGAIGILDTRQLEEVDYKEDAEAHEVDHWDDG